MLTILRDYFESRRRMRVISGDFFRNGMHCDLLPPRPRSQDANPLDGLVLRNV